MARLGPAADAVTHGVQRLIERLFAVPGFEDAILTVADELIEEGWWVDQDLRAEEHRLRARLTPFSSSAGAGLQMNGSWSVRKR